MSGESVAELLADLEPDERDEVLASLSPAQAAALRADWRFWARPEQLLPELGTWDVHWMSGGRGSGKTRAGAEGAAELARAFPDVDGAIIAPTFQADALRKCVESQSGLLRALGGERGPLVKSYNRSEGVIYLKSGASIFATGAADGATHIQGENLGWVWCDEVGLWKRATSDMAWNESIQFAVRIHPAVRIVTGTPKAGHPLVKLLNEDETVSKTVMHTEDNASNLDPDWLHKIVAKYEGTRLGAQELGGILIPEIEGALWTWVCVERNRWKAAWGLPKLVRVGVGNDPSGGANEIGIIGAGELKGPCPCGGQDVRGPHYAVLADESLIASPERWGRATTDLYHLLEADIVVAEPNFGGDMVMSTLRVADPTVNVKPVHSARGKAIRAEPVSALYEQDRVHHVGVFPDLETEQTTWVPGDDWSPNRMDAAVFVLTELMNRKSTRTIAPPTDRRVMTGPPGKIRS